MTVATDQNTPHLATMLFYMIDREKTMVYDIVKLTDPHMEGDMINVTKIGEAEHDDAFCVQRKHGHPVYLLLLVKTAAIFRTEDAELETPPDVAVLFRPGQRHSYRAAGERYADCWMHFCAPSIPLFEDFPFGKPTLFQPQ